MELWTNDLNTSNFKVAIAKSLFRRILIREHCHYIIILYSCHLLVNYGALMLKALFEHWPQVNVDSEEKPNSATSQVLKHTYIHTRINNIFSCIVAGS